MGRFIGGKTEARGLLTSGRKHTFLHECSSFQRFPDLLLVTQVRFASKRLVKARGEVQVSIRISFAQIKQLYTCTSYSVAVCYAIKVLFFVRYLCTYE